MVNNVLTFKGKVKSLTIDDCQYFATFDYCDKFKIDKDEYGIAYERKPENFETVLLKADENFNTGKEIFNFISQHLLEELEISYKNEPKDIVGVKISYE